MSASILIDKLNKKSKSDMRQMMLLRDFIVLYSRNLQNTNLIAAFSIFIWHSNLKTTSLHHSANK
jgi:hypothetical protein